jgi:tetratricopeptide (TPR) repeat protein
MPRLPAAAFTLAGALALAAASGGAAEAQPLPRGESPQAARPLFERGLAEMDARRYTPAVLLFEESYRLNPVPVVLYNLALAHRALGHHHAAIEHFERYLTQSGGDLPEGRAAAVTSAVSSLRAELAIVRLEVAPAAFTVNVDGRDARPADGALTLDPGAHTLLVGAPGHVAERRELRLAPAERYVFQTTLRREPTPHPPAPADARPVTSRWWFWALVGGAVVGGVAATLAVALSTTEGPAPGTRINVEAIGNAGR